jgi:hypothetical protein
MRDRYRQGIAGIEVYAQQVYQQGFAALASDQQDRILHDMELGIPGTFDGTSIQAATTDSAASGTEGGMRQATPGGPGIGARAFFNLLLSHSIAGFFFGPGARWQPRHGWLEADWLSWCPDELRR